MESQQEIFMDFGQAINAMKNGSTVIRQGLNSKGIFIKLQVPEAQVPGSNNKMTSAYIYIDTTDLQTDILAEDWQIVA